MRLRFERKFWLKIAGGLVVAQKWNILLLLGSAGLGYYFFGPWGMACSLPMVMALYLKSKFMIGEKLKVGHKAPDTTVVTMDGQRVNLLSYAKGDRPLVLNFGSFS